MRFLIILLLLSHLSANAQTYEASYIFNPIEAEKYNTPDYEYAKGLYDHVETLDCYFNDHYYLLLVIPKNKKYPKSIVIYGKNYKQLRQDYITNNKLMYEHKNIFQKIHHKLNEKYWDNANIINSLPLGWLLNNQD